MSWSIGFDTNWNRDIGYGVPAVCDHPECNVKIHRGLSYVCGGQPFGGEYGCGLYFCTNHLLSAGKAREHAQVCIRCRYGKLAFDAKPDVTEWMRWKLRDASWSQWRRENPTAVQKIRNQLRVIA